MSLELTDQVEHAPWMGGFDIDSLKHLGQQQVPCLFVVAFEDQVCNEVHEVAGDGVGVPDQVEGKLDNLLFQLSLKGNYNILSVKKYTVSSLREFVTES